MKLDWRKTFLIGFGFLGISIMWQLYDTFVPLFLQSGDAAFDAQSKTVIPGFGLSASLAGAVMTLDNIAALFILPLVGAWSDRTRTRIGRRFPFILVGAPLAAVAFALIPVAAGLIDPSATGSVSRNQGPFAFFMVASGLMLLSMALFRTPVVALMPDLTPSPLRGKANGVINFMGGVGGVVAAMGLGRLFGLSPVLTFGIGSALLMVAVLLLFFSVKEPPAFSLLRDETNEETLRSGLRSVAIIPAEYRKSLLLLMAAIFCWFVGYNAVSTFFSSYAVTTLGLSASSASTLFGVALIAFIAFAIPAGYIGARFGRKRTISLGLAVFAVLLVIAYFVPNPTAVAIILGLGGMGWALVNINSLPMVVDIARDERLLGTYTGLYYVASQSAAIFGPILNGLIIDLTGRNYSSIFLVTPAFFVLAILAMRLVTRGEAHEGVPSSA